LSGRHRLHAASAAEIVLLHRSICRSGARVGEADTRPGRDKAVTPESAKAPDAFDDLVIITIPLQFYGVVRDSPPSLP